MAKNIEMNQKTSSGYEAIYPKTNSDIVEVNSTTCNNLGISVGSNVSEALNNINTTKSDAEIGDTCISYKAEKKGWVKNESMFIDKQTCPKFIDCCNIKYNSSNFGLNFYADNFERLETVYYINNSFITSFEGLQYTLYPEFGPNSYKGIKKDIEIPDSDVSSVTLYYINDNWYAFSLLGKESGSYFKEYIRVYKTKDIFHQNWIKQGNDFMYEDRGNSTRPQQEIEVYYSDNVFTYRIGDKAGFTRDFITWYGGYIQSYDTPIGKGKNRLYFGNTHNTSSLNYFDFNTGDRQYIDVDLPLTETGFVSIAELNNKLMFISLSTQGVGQTYFVVTCDLDGTNVHYHEILQDMDSESPSFSAVKYDNINGVYYFMMVTRSEGKFYSFTDRTNFTDIQEYVMDLTGISKESSASLPCENCFKISGHDNFQIFLTDRRFINSNFFNSDIVKTSGDRKNYFVKIN